MGLTVRIKGYEGAYDCGYLTYGHFRMELCKAFYAEDPKMYEIFSRPFRDPFFEESADEIKYWNDHCNDDLDLFLWHSDCDGKFTPKECRKIYNAIKDLHMDMIGHNYGDMKPYNMLERWKDMFKYCVNRGVNMYFI